MNIGRQHQVALNHTKKHMEYWLIEKRNKNRGCVAIRTSHPLSFFKWSWRESNPRPHKETIRFLHAYLGLRFRAVARPKPPTTALSPKASFVHRSLHKLFPI